MGEKEYNNPYSTRLDRTTNTLIFAPCGQYDRISDSDRIAFDQVLSIWRPEGEIPIFMLRWKLTEWCNYKCPYCPQTHDRFARIGKYAAHAFDNYPLAKWVNAFSYHFQERRLSLVITGGEPMLDRENMVPLLKQLTAMPAVECIRIDTNASGKLDNFKEVDPEKIILNCSYHPSQVSKESFLNAIKQLLYFGYKIGMVNFIMGTDNFDIFKKVKEEIFELGIPINPNPQFNLEGPYSTEHLAVLKEELPRADFLYKTQGLSPYGNKCLFPSLAYQMDQTGKIHVGCHPQASGSFFENSLPPTFIGPVPCPNNSCMCLDMYSFLKDVNRNKNVNPLLIYSDMLKNKYHA